MGEGGDARGEEMHVKHVSAWERWQRARTCVALISPPASRCGFLLSNDGGSRPLRFSRSSLARYFSLVSVCSIHVCRGCAVITAVSKVLGSCGEESARDSEKERERALRRLGCCCPFAVLRPRCFYTQNTRERAEAPRTSPSARFRLISTPLAAPDRRTHIH